MRTEFRASAAAIIATVLGIVLVALLHRAVGISDSATIVTLLLIPLLVYGIVSGRLRELGAPGGWNAKFAALENKVEETKEQVEKQESKITDNEGATRNAVKLATLAATPREMNAQVTASPEVELAALVDTYNHIRATQLSGSSRTRDMTDVVRKMIDLAPLLAQFDVAGYLGSEDRGRRLAAYAYLYARPDYNFLDELVESVTNREDKPFGQYWGLQSISRNLAYRGRQTVPAGVVARLKSFAESLPRGTDRDYVVRDILREIETQAQEEDE
jgi:hypothetical protein